MFPLFKSGKNKSIPFLNLPLLIQERFAELCDSQTLLNFSQINQRTKWLSRKREVRENLRVYDKATNMVGDLIGIMIHNFIHKNLEVFGHLGIHIKKTPQENIFNGILKTYSSLSVSGGISNKIEILKHLVGPNVMQISLFISFSLDMDVEEQKQKINMLVDILFPVKKIFIYLSCHGTSEIMKNELMKLTSRPAKFKCKKYDEYDFVVTISDSANENNLWIQEPKKNKLKKFLFSKFEQFRNF